MLSKKMAFSLTSLITILALAFVVTPAMAGEFGVSLDTTNDASAADDYQLLHPGDGNKITLTVEFDKAVVLAKESVQIITLDKDGKLLSLQKFPAAAETAAKAGRVKSFSPAVEGTATTVKLLIAAGIASADPFNTDTSKKLEGTIGLVGADDGPPTVNSIERVGVNFRQLKTPKISPTANPTVQVRITLSEMPKKFDKDHINVTEAAVTSVVQLVPEGGTSLADFAASDTAPDNFPRTRKVFDEDLTGVDDIEGAISSNAFVALGASATVVQLDARKKYGGIHRAINEAKIITGTAYTYMELPDIGDVSQTTALDELDPKAVKVEFGIAAADAAPNATPPTLKVVPLKFSSGDTTTSAIDAPKKPGDAVTKPTVPMVADYADAALYGLAVDKYEAAFDKYREYQNAKTLYDGYMAAKMAEEMMDQKAQMEAYEKLDASVRAAASVPTGRALPGQNAMVYPYLVTLTPKYANTNDVVVKVKEFEDLTSPVPDRYIPPRLESAYKEGIDKLTIMVAEAKVGPVKTAGIEVKLLNEGIIPKDGYLVVAKNKGGSAVRDPGDAKKSPLNTDRQPFALTYNLIDGGLVNLEAQLINGLTIDLVAPQSGLVISEIMWGSDASLDPDDINSQYIEIRNTSGAEIKMGDGTHKLVFYPFGAALPDMSVAANNVQDRVGTVGVHGHWSVIGKGQSGRTGVGEAPGDVVARTPTLGLISMQRVEDATSATGLAADGTDPMSWGASSPPGLNFDPNKEGQRVGSPGRAPIAYPTTPTTPTPPTPAADVAKAGDIEITEIMVDTGNGRLPQWIELTNTSGAEVSLADWSLQITNPSDDDEVIGASVTIDLSGTLGVGGGMDAGGTMGKSLLLVAGTARSSANLAGSDRVVDVSDQLDQRGRYTLISMTAFMIALIPPQDTGVLKYGDKAGNLGATEAWDIPMDETGRSSLIRRQLLTDGMATMGTSADGWVLASSTSLVSGPTTWYGSDEDAGTPGYDAGGPLPVELSHFRPARDKQTGAVVITWATQSELNNAGFFIKRSNQRNGQFEVVNATMIAGAGTTSEKQFYTYTDTTAQPNVVYYYQIEDVSLDGNRQLLTRGTRLKGHIGAAGKATVIWGELKTSNE